ncbi:hypothetical protein C7I55_24270 [Sphingomonas deserti]|uniref:OmpA-like domain-containing protein n=2 Tax=Allosphingosinicella deserti TaxID=2116704 RepID=A0A2P7QFS2_9SPHN|nr:hypothetical protein C7I55_24270 [Sphingomonas deserti]
MRISVLWSIASLIIGVGSAPAIAQTQPEPTVEGYLCTFAGKCGDAPAGEQPTRAAPATKGFRLARPGAEPQAQANAPAARPIARSDRRTPPRQGTRTANRARSSRYASASAAASTPALRPSEAPRADLMIGFDLNSATITSDGMAKARIFAQSLLMPELRGKRFLIEGHTDSRGGIPLNMELSRRRAEAVANFLAQQGVERSRVEVRGFGPTNPLPGRKASDPRNRRVEAKLIA